MDFKNYQNQAKKHIVSPEKDIIPFLGLVGEAGVLLSEYKKKIRDGKTPKNFNKKIEEELGDLLWYISAIASQFNLDLNKIAEENLKKIKAHYPRFNENNLFYMDGLYDEKCPKDQRLPRKFSYKISEETDKDGLKVAIIEDSETNEVLGNPLDDNSSIEDGYRYHDIMHLTFMATLGWSPVFRKFLIEKKVLEKRKNHKAEDSGRSQVVEEAIVLLAYTSMKNYQPWNSLKRIDSNLLYHIKNITQFIEVKNVPTHIWEKVLIKGLQLWEDLTKHSGGIIEGDLEKREIIFKKSPT